MMIFRKITTFTLLIILPILAELASGPTRAVQAAPLASLPANDTFGYTASTGVLIPLDVCGDLGSTEISFGSPESFSGAVSFTDFNFPFYEKSYSEFRASINGLVTFSDGNLEAYDHLPMPSDIIPNDLIAPFWTDLELSTGDPAGKVCYKNYPADASHGKYLAVEWNHVELNDVPDAFTFQALMFENGNIQFQYPVAITKVDYATVGIEDNQGIFGLQVYYNEPGLQANSAILITPPATHPAGRFVPTFSSDFLIKREANVKLTLQNITGQVNPVRFDLAIGDAPAGGCNWNTLGWEVALFQGTSQLVDTNGNACPDIQIQPDSQVELTARIRVAQMAPVGDYKQFTLTALPAIGGFGPVDMELQAAVPAGFAQAYVSNDMPMTLTLTWEKGQSNSEAGEIFSGKNLALTNTGRKGYFYAWERYHAGGSYLLGTIFNGYGYPLRFSFNLTELLNGLLDQEVAVGSSPNGNLAIAWIRNGNELFVSSYSSMGVPLVERKKIQTGINPSAPRIAADANNNFYVVWVQDGTSQRDIFMAILNPSGEFVRNATPVTDLANTTEDYFSPTITNLRSGGAIIAYSVDTGMTETPQLIAYNVIDGMGIFTQPEQRITYAGIRARGKDMIQLTSGKVLIGWIDENTRHVHYTLLTKDASGWTDNDVNPWELSPAYQLGAINISVTSDYLDHGIITWAEEKGNRTLSYALIDSTGDVLTPPMVFLRGTGVDTNAAGQGNAPYDGRHFLFIPLILR